jgi:murein DD-endopeptidase MepM/ murein hydrolase activator NlpD
VAWVINDRFPYGNALVVETPLDSLPSSLLAALNPPTPGLVTPDPALTCPPYSVPPEWTTPSYSLYVVYAHLLAAPAFQPGQVLSCDQSIGQIGQSGNALNPHLHFEVRIGPAGARLNSMAHYDNSATLDEMGAYCTWRVSGWFRTLDPLALLALQP